MKFRYSIESRRSGGNGAWAFLGNESVFRRDAEQQLAKLAQVSRGEWEYRIEDRGFLVGLPALIRPLALLGIRRLAFRSPC